MIRRVFCRLTHRRGWIDEGRGAVWCPTCGDAR